MREDIQQLSSSRRKEKIRIVTEDMKLLSKETIIAYAASMYVDLKPFNWQQTYEKLKKIDEELNEKSE
ncbi:MAG: hypothetical protein Kow0098_03310 [Ignavibacteriaceae bacterium]